GCGAAHRGRAMVRARRLSAERRLPTLEPHRRRRRPPPSAHRTRARAGARSLRGVSNAADGRKSGRRNGNALRRVTWRISRLRAAPPSYRSARRSGSHASRERWARGANEDGGHSVVSPAAAEDSYRLAALSHESRNLRKSARVSLSVASCARAAHSAAFCRQYPIFCHMTVPPLEPAARSNSPRQEPRERTRGMLDHIKSRGGL